jgi:hypothetical protein
VVDREKLFLSVRDAIINKPFQSYERIAEEHGVCIATVQKVARILKTENGFRRPLGRPLGSGKRNGSQGPLE